MFSFAKKSKSALNEKDLTEEKISRLRGEVKKQAEIRQKLVNEIGQNLDSMRHPVPLLLRKG